MKWAKTSGTSKLPAQEQRLTSWGTKGMWATLRWIPGAPSGSPRLDMGRKVILITEVGFPWGWEPAFHIP